MRDLKKILLVAFSVIFAFSSIGCGLSGDLEKANQIRIWHIGSESQAHTIVEISKEFTEKTGVEVVCEAISWGNAHSKYLTSIAGEVTPDIGTMGLTWGMEFGELGAIVDLKEAFPEDVAVMEGKIFPGMLESTQVGEKVYGIPFDLSEHILYYRKDIVKDPPQDWGELMETVKDLKAQGKGMIIDWGSLGWIGYSPFLWQAGGDYYNKDHTKATVGSSQAAKALDFFAQLYKEGVPRTKVPIEQGLRTGDYPLAISGNWKIISLTVSAPEIKGKWGIALLPKGPTGKRTAFIGGSLMSIFSKSKMKKESWEFMKFLFKPENQIKLYESSLETEDSYLPPNMNTWKNLPMEVEFKKVLEAQAKDAKGPPPVLSWDASTSFVDHAVQMVILKNADSLTELNKAQVEMQKELDKKRR